MGLLLIIIFLLGCRFNLVTISSVQLYLWNLVLFPPLFGMWVISSLAETNRAPFDLAEGESELVSGFNIEYGGGEFAFLFIAEYGRILFMSLLTTLLFIGGLLRGLGLFPLLKFVFVIYLFLWVRGSFPRIRYDVLISLT